MHLPLSSHSLGCLTRSGAGRACYTGHAKRVLLVLLNHPPWRFPDVLFYENMMELLAHLEDIRRLIQTHAYIIFRSIYLFTDSNKDASPPLAGTQYDAIMHQKKNKNKTKTNEKKHTHQYLPSRTENPQHLYLASHDLPADPSSPSPPLFTTRPTLSSCRLNISSTVVLDLDAR